MAALAAGAAGCGEPAGPAIRVGPPYIAIVTRAQAPAGVSVDGPFRYHIEELSQSLNIDTTITAAPSDTVLLSVPPATYRVTILDVPAACRVQGGVSQIDVIADGINTALFRFLILCQAQLVIENLVSGQFLDEEFVYRVEDSAGTVRLGVVGSLDTVLLDRFAPGPATVHLSHVSENCLITSDGGADQTVRLPATGGVTAAFRIACSDVTARPKILSVGTSIVDGVNGLVLRVFDPDRDADRFFWDLTDCRLKSVLQGGGRSRGGLTTGRTARADTIVVLAAYETGLTDADLRDRCVRIRVVDLYGNSSQIVERRLTAPASGQPFPLGFNAFYFGTTALRVRLTADDPDGDFLGVFVTARLRDGVLGPPDGEPDIGVYNPSGYLDTTIPDIPLGDGRIPYGDYLAVIVYLFDQTGKFRRVEDSDLFQ